MEESPASHQAGLTLIEIIIVMMIFALGWFMLLPNLTPESDSSVEELSEVNHMLTEVKNEALSGKGIQRLIVRRSEKTVVWGDKIATLPSSVSNCQINGRSRISKTNIFRIYPSGVMDEVRLSLSDGRSVYGQPLAAALSLKP